MCEQPKETVIEIDENGLAALWDDDLFAGNEDCVVTRASNVLSDGFGKWIVQLTGDPLNRCYANMYLVEGGATSSRDSARRFARRDDAIAAEREFINKYIIGKGVTHG